MRHLELVSFILPLNNCLQLAHLGLINRHFKIVVVHQLHLKEVQEVIYVLADDVQLAHLRFVLSVLKQRFLEGIEQKHQGMILVF